MEWRAEADSCNAKEQAKKRVSNTSQLIIMELIVIGRGDHHSTAQQGEGKDVKAANIQPVCRA